MHVATEPPSLHYYCAVVLHSCFLLPPVGHSSNYEYHYCQLTRQSSCVSNFYRTFKVFVWLSLVHCNRSSSNKQRKWGIKMEAIRKYAPGLTVLSCSSFCLWCCWIHMHDKSTFKSLFLHHSLCLSFLIRHPLSPHTHTQWSIQNVLPFCACMYCTWTPMVLFVMDLHYTAAIDMDVFFFYCTVMVSSIVAPVQSFVEKLSLLWPWGLQDFKASRIPRQLAHEGDKVVCPTHRPPLPPGNIPDTHFWVDPRAIARPEWLSQWNISKTPAEIEPATFRLVAQCFNRLFHSHRLL